MIILLAVKNAQVLSRWQSLLDGSSQLEHAASFAELKKRISGQSYDLVMLHGQLLDGGSLAEITSLAPAGRIFLLSDQPDHEEGFAFLKMGIVGYGNTYISGERLTEAVHVITSGGVWLGQKVIQQLIREAHKNSENGGEKIEAKLAVLTPKERRVADLVARGETNLEIAADLAISERTVKAHLTSIYEKLHVGNRLSLALLVNKGMPG
jgi:DNA-binding NarL/FixJ family response regulator